MFITAFFQGVNIFNFIAAVNIHTDFRAQESKICHCFHFFLICLLWNDGTRCHDVFLELSCFFDDPTDAGNLISGSSAFSKSSLIIWKFLVHILLKPSLENFEHYFAIMWDECNSAVVWTFFGTAFLWDWNENWPFSVLWPLLSFPNLLALSQHHLWGFEIVQLEFYHLH